MRMNLSLSLPEWAAPFALILAPIIAFTTAFILVLRAYIKEAKNYFKPLDNDASV